ncbi:MAG: response regulator [Bacteroidota bacterium]
MSKIDIFYADDDADDVFFFNEIVEQVADESEKQINLHIHFNGDKLIENIKKNKESNGVVFLDINMPCKNGFQILEEIRNEPEINEFPVIMFSTSSSKDNIDKSQYLGANLYVVKPNNFNDFLKMILTFIEINWKNHVPDFNNFIYKT